MMYLSDMHQSKLVLTFLPGKRNIFFPFDDKMQLLIIHNLRRFILRLFFHFNFRVKHEKIAFTVVYSRNCDCSSAQFLTHTQSILKNRRYPPAFLKVFSQPLPALKRRASLELCFPWTVDYCVRVGVSGPYPFSQIHSYSQHLPIPFSQGYAVWFDPGTGIAQPVDI